MQKMWEWRAREYQLRMLEKKHQVVNGNKCFVFSTDETEKEKKLKRSYNHMDESSQWFLKTIFFPNLTLSFYIILVLIFVWNKLFLKIILCQKEKDKPWSNTIKSFINIRSIHVNIVHFKPIQSMYWIIITEHHIFLRTRNIVVHIAHFEHFVYRNFVVIYIENMIIPWCPNHLCVDIYVVFVSMKRMKKSILSNIINAVKLSKHERVLRIIYWHHWINWLDNCML